MIDQTILYFLGMLIVMTVGFIYTLPMKRKKTKHYCLGFLFNPDETVEQLVLIRKKKPAWQAGHLNGVGGFVEKGETPLQAMIREFKEETGVDVHAWTLFCRMHHKGDIVHCFFASSSRAFAETRQTTDEPLVKVSIGTLNNHNPMPNIGWLVKMAQAKQLDPNEAVFDIIYNL